MSHKKSITICKPTYIVDKTNKKTNILVLCTGNSCRSQMAEGYLRYFAGDKVAVYSAGIEVHGVNPRAVAIMKEDGIDISQHTSNHIDEYRDIPFDFLITVCDHARECCPFFPSTASLIHPSFPDPAKATGSENEINNEFRTVRNAIREFCYAFVREHC